MAKQFFGARPVLTTGLVLILAYLGVAALTPFLPLNVVASSMLLALSIAVTGAYWREAVDGLLREGGPTRSDQLAMGICLSWACIAGQRISALAYRLFGADGWLSNDIVTGLIFGSCLAAVLHLTAPTDIRAAPKFRSRIALWLALAGGAGLAGFLLGTQWSG